MIVSYKKVLCAMVTAGVLVSLHLTMVSPVAAQSQPYDTPSAAAAEIRFQQLEKELRRLTGMVEQQGYEIRRLKAELLKSSGDLEMRVKDLEGGNNKPLIEQPLIEQLEQPATNISDSTPLNAPQNLGNIKKPTQTLGTISTSQNSGEVLSFDDAPKAYDYAYSFIKARDFARAETEFAKFMKDFPNHSLVANAKYWYGETFYVRGGYEKAARIFAEGYKLYPKGSKAASNLLKLGMSLTGMGKSDDACVAYKQLKKDYAKSSLPVLKRAEIEMKRINCR